MKRALFIGYVWPEPKTTAAGNRMLQLLHAFLDQGYQITFVSTATKTLYSDDISELGIDTETILLNDSGFNLLVADLLPDVVVFDRFMVEEQFGWRVAEAVPNALRILNTEDLHALRKAREACFKTNVQFTVDHWLQHDMTKREVASIYRCDLTLLVSTFEERLLQESINVSSKLLYHLPFLLEEITSEQQKKWPNFVSRKDFICFGNGKHAPNVAAIRFLKKEIWPLVRKQLPNANVHIYGAYLPQQLLEFHDAKTGFLVHGWTDNLDSELQHSRINLAPLVFGAGIKGKLTKAMCNGTPSITTTIGAEGMHGKLPWAGELANTASEIAQKAVKLYENKTAWLQKQHYGVATINTLYQKQRLQEQFFKALEQLSITIKEHRGQNFIGNLLMHQTLASTKYMGKWIEEKNKS